MDNSLLLSPLTIVGESNKNRSIWTYLCDIIVTTIEHKAYDVLFFVCVSVQNYDIIWTFSRFSMKLK